MKKVLIIVGSLREGSFNKQLSLELQKMLEKNNLSVSYLDYKQLPLINQDVENPTLEVVSNVRKQVEESDLLWIVSPVYNWGIPGNMKNLIDWLSRPITTNPNNASVIKNKTVTITSVAASGHQNLFERYSGLLTVVGTKVVGNFTAIPINKEAWSTNILTVSSEDLKKLEEQVNQVVELI